MNIHEAKGSNNAYLVLLGEIEPPCLQKKEELHQGFTQAATGI